MATRTKSKALPGFLFVFFLAFLSFMLGAMAGSLFFVPKGSGLAGPAIALGYGFVGLIAAVIIGILIVRRLSYLRLRRALLFTSVVMVIAILALVYRVQTLSRQRTNSPPSLPEKTTAPNGFGAVVFSPNQAHAAQTRKAIPPLGLGMVKPRIIAGRVLRFYNPPDFSKLADQTLPADSLVFAQGKHFVEINMAPPWFWPEVMKLDYSLLFLRVKTLSKNWIEVVVNTQTGRTAWMDRWAVDFIEWPAFLLDVYAVEARNPESNPLRVKPLDHTSPALPKLAPRAQLRPIAVQNNWLRVEVILEGEKSVQSGWIRWRRGEQLLISFSLLS